MATRALAVCEQVRVVTQDTPSASFAGLAADPLNTLGRVYDAMLEYASDWKERVLSENALRLDEAALAECASDYDGFLQEIDRFAAGIAALKGDERLLAAFTATNRVFARQAKGYDAWRLFQIVFITTQLTALAAREGLTSGDYVDLIPSVPHGTPPVRHDGLRSAHSADRPRERFGAHPSRHRSLLQDCFARMICTP